MTKDMQMMMYFNPVEREYVRGMKRKDRTELSNVLCKRSMPFNDVPLRIQVLQSNLPEHVKIQLFNDLRSPPSDKLATWICKVLKLPHAHPSLPVSSRALDVAITEAVCAMDATIAGHCVAKREILKMVSRNVLNPHATTSYAIGLEGPPGTGKTQFAKRAIGAALQRPVITIPLGGASDLSFLLGNLYTYEGSKEGRLAAALIEAGCCDPILFFDELDKVSTTERGAEIIGTLIHLIDPSTNSALRDRYFHGIDIDFSKCTIVFSYNHPERINPILLDRITRVPFASPADSERVDIVMTHFVTRVQTRLGTTLALSDECVRAILDAHKDDVGLRDVEKDVDNVLSTALLCQTCPTTLSLFGLSVSPVRDGTHVCKEFYDDLRSMTRSCTSFTSAPPPFGMYN